LDAFIADYERRDGQRCTAASSIRPRQSGDHGERLKATAGGYAARLLATPEFLDWEKGALAEVT
jgi:hypothetical protein